MVLQNRYKQRIIIKKELQTFKNDLLQIIMPGSRFCFTDKWVDCFYKKRTTINLFFA